MIVFCVIAQFHLNFSSMCRHVCAVQRLDNEDFVVKHFNKFHSLRQHFFVDIDGEMGIIGAT